MKQHYTEAERQHFTNYVADRARYRPAECHGGLDCWVDYGPPAMSPKRGSVKALCCVGCAGAPLIPREEWRNNKVRYRR